MKRDLFHLFPFLSVFLHHFNYDYKCICSEYIYRLGKPNYTKLDAEMYRYTVEQRLI